jgi:hypothetical protein
MVDLAKLLPHGSIENNEDLQNRVVAFSDELDRLGYTRAEQVGAMGGLLGLTISLMDPPEGLLVLVAHIEALQELVADRYKIRMIRR